MTNIKNNKAITKRSDDFAQWYTDVVRAAKLANYSSLKGFIIFEPNGYGLWERIQQELDKKFKETGHENVYMPLLIPESMLAKESELLEGFMPEVAWVTEGGTKKLQERVCIRPTSETVFCDYYSKSISSYRDLPKLLNQWCSVVRWEKETRPFLRSREFLWQEGHTAHATSDEAETETVRMLEVYRAFVEDFLAIPVISGRKTESEKFAGAEYTLTIEALMYNGVSLQAGTSHYFGQKFSKAYDISFSDKNSQTEYAYQTSWGMSTRIIGALIMVHGDDKGLIIPPRIAPKQVVIVPITNDQNILNAVELVREKLLQSDVKVIVDLSENSPGFKFAESEVRGIPIRLEIGKRDLENGKVMVVRRDTGEKIELNSDDTLPISIKNILDKIQENLFVKAKQRLDDLTFEAQTIDEAEQIIREHPGFVKAMWCGDSACEEKMKERSGIKSRCIITGEKPVGDNCVVCNKKASNLVIWGIQY
jgi:prolyl-tRNA synthetase